MFITESLQEKPLLMLGHGTFNIASSPVSCSVVKGENTSATALTWFPSDTAHICVIILLLVLLSIYLKLTKLQKFYMHRKFK